MNVNPLIISALSEIGPAYPNVCPITPLPDEYITFNYADERPVVYADDADIFDETVVQVHLFTRHNPQTKKKQIRKCLRQAGFMIQSTQEFYEDDTGYTHVVVTVCIEGAIDDEGG